MSRWALGMMAFILVATAGCTITLSRRSPWDIQRLEELSDELERFQTLAQLQEEEAQRLRHAKARLEEAVGSSGASVGYDERGVVTRFMDQVLFDSGKTELRSNSLTVLDRVAKVLRELPMQPVQIEGHTDNEPIRYSGWTDNDELSMARANAVAEYLTTNQQIEMTRLTVIGYGEERPIASNDTPEGRQENRRVEIVILPMAKERQRFLK